MSTPTTNQHSETEHADKQQEVIKGRYEEVPRLFANTSEEEAFREYRVLKDRQDINAKIDTGQALSPLEERRRVTYEAQRLGRLSDEERATLSRYAESFEGKVVNYQKAAEFELKLAPGRQSFEGFASIKSELNDMGETGEPTPRVFGEVALEEVQILLHRLFGKNHALRTFFEQHVVLKYNGERPQQERDATRQPYPPGAGGAVITRGRDRNGLEKYIVSVDSDTFLETVTWHDSTGRTHEYSKPNYLNAAFTIGRAILQVAVGDEAFQEFADQYKAPSAPMPEKLLEGGAPQRVDLADKGNNNQQALDFLAYCLFDPEQAKKINSQAASAAKRLFDGIHPNTARELNPGGEAIHVGQSSLNLTYLYHDYDPLRRPKNALGKFGAGLAKDSVRDLGFWGRVGAGAAGGFGLSLLTGGASSWLTAAGAIAGKVTTTPLKYIRTLQSVYQERYDFYFELAVAEHEKKELARIMDREEGTGDRLKRMRIALDSGDEESVRWILLSLAKSSVFNLWHVYLYLMHTDSLFKQTGGQEITQQSYNFVTRLHRFSNQAKRIGSVIGIYGQEVDQYGRKRFVLKDYDAVQGAVNQQWAARSDNEAQNATLETFDMMGDGTGFMNLEDEYGAGIDKDPNARGWRVGDVGDLRGAIGQEHSHELFHFLQHEWKGDRKFLRKFNVYEIGAIQRMQLIEKSRFNGQYMKKTAKEAFDHFNPIVGGVKKPMQAEDAAALKAVEERGLATTLDDDTLDTDQFRRLAQQVEGTERISLFGGDTTRGTTKQMTGLGSLKRNLEELNKEVDRGGFSKELRTELKSLNTMVGIEAGGTWNEARDGSFQDKLAQGLDRVDRILTTSSADGKAAFQVQTWLAKLQRIEPEARAIAEFRRDLETELRPYQAALELAKNPVVVRDVDRIVKELGRIGTDKKLADPAVVSTAVQAMTATLEPYRGLTGMAEKLDSFALLTIATNPDMLAERAKLIADSLNAWTATYKQGRTSDRLLAKTAALAKKVEQAMLLQRKGIQMPPVDPAEHTERVRQFKELDVIDPALLAKDDLTEHEMHRALKLSGVVLGRLNDQELAASKKGQGRSVLVYDEDDF